MRTYREIGHDPDVLDDLLGRGRLAVAVVPGKVEKRKDIEGGMRPGAKRFGGT